MRDSRLQVDKAVEPLAFRLPAVGTRGGQARRHRLGCRSSGSPKSRCASLYRCLALASAIVRTQLRFPCGSVPDVEQNRIRL